ncbi:MAG: helix-turn-helix transcriptional regulator [Planctomycetota bacterium]|jgi:ribosome-binding protein aMBF1 (putative translation factor)|nr:helix-turn-helix transcriptional regulator [Planctomycetota bacterium]
MAKKRISRRVKREGPSADEARRLAEVRKKARKEFPPRDPPRLQHAELGIGAKIRAAREQQGLTWYALAKLSQIPNPATVRDIEYGRDAKLSNIEAIASALGLELELVEAQALT